MNSSVANIASNTALNTASKVVSHPGTALKGLRQIMALVMAVVLLFLAVGCSTPTSFEAQVTVEGLGTQNLSLIYFDGSAIRNETVTAVDSKFSFTGALTEPTVVELFSNVGALIGRFVVAPGDKLDVALNPNNLLDMNVKGNKISKALAEFLGEVNDTSNLNEAIERQVASDPSAPLSAILLTYYYDANANVAMADSLFSIVDLSAFPSPVSIGSAQLMAMNAHAIVPDSLVLKRSDLTDITFLRGENATIICLTQDYAVADDVERAFKNDSLKDAAKAFIRMTPDTTGLHMAHRRLGDDVAVLWVPGGQSNHSMSMLKASLPKMFIVADSLGSQIYRGDDLRAAVDSAFNLLSR